MYSTCIHTWLYSLLSLGPYKYSHFKYVLENIILRYVLISGIDYKFFTLLLKLVKSQIDYNFLQCLYLWFHYYNNKLYSECYIFVGLCGLILLLNKYVSAGACTLFQIKQIMYWYICCYHSQAIKQQETTYYASWQM